MLYYRKEQLHFLNSNDNGMVEEYDVGFPGSYSSCETVI